MGKLIIANWKMNPLTAEEAVRVARGEDLPDVAIAAPFLHLATLGRVLRRASLAAQDISSSEARIGPMTGEVSGAMLASFGVRYVLVGHSERRRPPHGKGEDNLLIAAKVRAAVSADITPILCVGEPWNVRRKGFSAAKAYVTKQLIAGLAGYRARAGVRCLVAYEPVWAISTSAHHRTAAPEEAAVMGSCLLEKLEMLLGRRKSAVLYGGSVSASNAATFLALPEFSGLLVGGASLDSREFRRIVGSALPDTADL